MKMHHLNCGTCCPVGGRLFDGYSHGISAHLVCHCLLLETNDGLVLIDTGYGTQDVTRPRERLSDFFLALNRPQLRAEETAAAQIRRLGFAPADVRHIVVTHLDFDHAGGIEDFPNARIHVTAREKEVADQRRGGAFVSRKRYRPQQWDEASNWSLYPHGESRSSRLIDCSAGPVELPAQRKLAGELTHKSPFGCPSPPPNFRPSFMEFHGNACLPFKRSVEMTAWKSMASESRPERCKLSRLAWSRS
jgi:glyoxylase-like metal-dependent hydrolase (beta-lactamase superfamily II)